MTVNYIFKINDAKTKDIIRNLPSMKNFCDDLSCVNFKSAELHNGGERSISLTVSLDREMDPGFFRHLTNEIGKKTGIKVECSFEFGGEIAPGSMFKPYWAFFISSVKQMKSWLNHEKPEYSRGKLILICQGEIIYRKLSAPGAMKKMKKEIKSFFGKIPEIELAESVKTDVNAPPELIRTVLSGENKENSESYILKEKQINGKITPIENIAEEGRYVVEGNIFFSGDYKRGIKNTRGKDDANPYVLVFYITDNRDTIKLFTFVKNGDSLVDILPSLSRVRAVIEVKYDDREGELTGKVKKMCRVSDIKNIDEEKEKRVEMHAHTQMS